MNERLIPPNLLTEENDITVSKWVLFCVLLPEQTYTSKAELCLRVLSTFLIHYSFIFQFHFELLWIVRCSLSIVFLCGYLTEL